MVASSLPAIASAGEGRVIERGRSRLFKVGEFSRLGRVSVRMLRHYDTLGLLRPARVDPLNDYRYYAADQLPRLNRIVALRDLGFSLAQISRLLDDELPLDQLRGMLALRRAELEQQVSSAQARLAAVEARLAQIALEGRPPPHDVVVRAIPSRRAAMRRAVLATEFAIADLFDEVESFVAAHRARAEAPPVALYHDAEYRERDLDVQVAVPIAAALPANGRIAVGELPAIPAAACVTHVGCYSRIAEAAAALFTWIAAHEYMVAGPPREVYVRFGPGALPFDLPAAYLADRAEDYVTELQIPIGRGNDDAL